MKISYLLLDPYYPGATSKAYLDADEWSGDPIRGVDKHSDRPLTVQWDAAAEVWREVKHHTTVTWDSQRECWIEDE